MTDLPPKARVPVSPSEDLIGFGVGVDLRPDLPRTGHSEVCGRICGDKAFGAQVRAQREQFGTTCHRRESPSCFGKQEPLHMQALDLGQADRRGLGREVRTEGPTVNLIRVDGRCGAVLTNPKVGQVNIETQPPRREDQLVVRSRASMHALRVHLHQFAKGPPTNKSSGFSDIRPGHRVAIVQLIPRRA